MNTLDDIPISQLFNKTFSIPDYQRGYKWSKQQVTDLLNDINDFQNENGFYCLQPLVVKPLKQNHFEVIDGQQRLTTIFLILCYLSKAIPYALEYDTRENSKDYLAKFKDYENNKGSIEKDKDSNCDFFHIYNSFMIIKEFFKDKNKEQFCDKLKNKVKFIWYSIEENENPISVFTRLNIGKIPLTNSELIKALILNRANFSDNTYMNQLQISSDWDKIEYALQINEFWYFLNSTAPIYNTRINFIFDIIENNDYLGIREKINNVNDTLGTDSYRTFRYVNYYINNISTTSKENAVKRVWKEVKEIFRYFSQWYNDLELYHYIGFLNNCEKGYNSIKLLSEIRPKKTREELNTYLIENIHDVIKDLLDFSKTYDLNEKRKLKPLLLLHNIETIVQQNKNYKEKYYDGVFYKFPFHLYQNEKWDIEHIDSNIENDLSDDKSCKEFILSIYVSTKDDNIKKKIKEILDMDENNEKKSKKINEFISTLDKEDSFTEDEKNQLMNFTLLDEHTNRSYGNSVFSVKRRVILGKDQGIKYKYDYENYKLIEDKSENYTSFIPLCTKNVFSKNYSVVPNDLTNWSKMDGQYYIENIKTTLNKFINIK